MRSDGASDDHSDDGDDHKIWTRRVQCETRRILCVRPVFTLFARLSAHVSGMDQTRPVLHRTRPMCASGVAITLRSSLCTRLVWTGRVQCDQVVSLVLCF